VPQKFNSQDSVSKTRDVRLEASGEEEVKPS